MNITQEKIDDLNAILKVQVKQEDYQPRVDKVLKDYRKKAQIPGFRKGHVPMGMVKKMVGPQTMVDEINKLLSEQIYEYINKEKIDILGNPLPKDSDKSIDWENGTEFEFLYEVGLAPQFDLKFSEKGIKHYDVTLNDKELDEVITDLAKRYGKMSNPESATEGDMLYGTFREMKADGSIQEGGIYNKSVVVIDEVVEENTKKSLIGKKPGEVFELDPKLISANEADQARALGVQAHELATIDAIFQFEVEKVNRMEPADINQELFDKVLGKDKVEGEDAFRKHISDDMTSRLEKEALIKLRYDIQDVLMENVKVDFPDEFLKRWIKASNENPITDEQLETEYPGYKLGLKWQLIENKIVQENGIQVSREEIVEHTKSLMQQRMLSMGVNTEMPDEELTQIANNVLQNEEETRKIYGEIFGEKMIKHFVENYKFKKESVSYEGFKEIAAATK